MFQFEADLRPNLPIAVVIVSVFHSRYRLKITRLTLKMFKIDVSLLP